MSAIDSIPVFLRYALAGREIRPRPVALGSRTSGGVVGAGQKWWAAARALRPVGGKMARGGGHAHV